MNATATIDAATEVLSARTFRRAMNRIYGVADRRGTAPILATVHVQSDGSKMSLTTTDLDRRVTVTVDAPGSDVLDVAIWSRALRDFVAGAEGPLSLSAMDDGKVRLACGSLVGTLPTLPVADFPSMPFPVNDKEGNPQKVTLLRLDAGDLRHALAVVRHAISREETRYYLNGVFFHAIDQRLALVATDGARLVRQIIAGTALDAAFHPIIVPRDVIDWLYAHMGAGDVSLSLATTHLRAEVEGGSITARVIDGSYPPYEKVIPAPGSADTLVLGPEEMQTIRWLARQERKADQGVEIVCNGAILAKVRDYDGGHFEAPLHGERTGADRSFSIKARFLIDAFEAGDVERLELGAGSLDPIRVNYADPDRVGVLMPMRL